MPDKRMKVGLASFEPGARCEVVRSFSYKLNCGNYQSCDFFCSQKSECSIDDAEDISDRLYQFCKQQVMAAVKEYKQQIETVSMRKAS